MSENTYKNFIKEILTLLSVNLVLSGILLAIITTVDSKALYWIIWIISSVMINVLLGKLLWNKFSNNYLLKKAFTHSDKKSNNIDFSYRLPSELTNKAPEINRFNHLMQSLEVFCRNVQREAESQTHEYGELETITQQLIDDAMVQSTCAKDTTDSITSLNHQINEIADNALEVNQLVDTTLQSSQTSSESVQKVTLEISETATAMDSLASTMKTLEQSTGKIADIATVINSIAAQTNLLALNAAIEAARAGEQGRGFAVVADEVRNLANKTANATSEIGELIESNSQQTQKAISDMMITREKVIESVSKTSDTQVFMLETGEHMQSVVNKVNQIVESTQQQLKRSSEIANAADHLNILSQSNRLALMQTMSGIKRTSIQTAELQESASTFEVADVDVIHSWAEGGDMRALSAIKKILNDNGHHWVDKQPSADILSDVNTRLSKNNPPTAAAIAGVKRHNFAKNSVLADLSSVAKKQRWQSVLPKAINQLSQVNNIPSAAVISVARTNTLWVNKQMIEQAGVYQQPKSWNEFFDCCKSLQSMGYTALAHSNQDWQIATVFESVVVSVCGAQWYRDSFCKGTGVDELIPALEAFKGLKIHCADDPVGKDWTLLASDIISGRAAIQIMGDWAKGEYQASNLELGEDYLCWTFPGHSEDYVFASDTLLMFKQSDKKRHKAQMEFAEILMSKQGQIDYNNQKGSIPTRQDIETNQLDAYGKISHSSFLKADQSDQLAPSAIHNMALQDDKKLALIAAIEQYWHDDLMSANQAAQMILSTVA